VTRHFLEVDDLESDELTAVLDLADLEGPPQVLAGRGVALLFEKPSLRTRNATEMAVAQLGGHPLSLRAEEVDVDVREPASDVARVLSRYHAVLGARVFEHTTLERMAEAASVPVVNLLSERSHPCQAVADLLTLRRHFGQLAGLKIAYVGDFNNVARSLGRAAALSGFTVRYACPDGYGPDAEELQSMGFGGARVSATHDPPEAVEGAQAVYTDVWTSMGSEDEVLQRRRAFEGFTVDQELMGRAQADAVFLHCLPAHRGEEVTGDVVGGDQSLVWDPAENRMHAVRGLLLFLLGAGEGNQDGSS
jgi:ornithine carbamoyltransferase